MTLATRLAAAFALLLLPALASAQQEPQHPLAGVWAGVMSEAEDSEVLVDLRIIGEVVTGPINTSSLGDLYIRDGQVTGNTIHFKSPSLSAQGEGPALVWSGQLTGNNELAFSVAPESGDGAVKEFVLRKRESVPGGGR